MCSFITVSSVWMLNPNCCTPSSVLFRYFNDNVTHINITVATTERDPEQRVLDRAPASLWDAQTAYDALEISRVIFHLSPRYVLEFISLALSQAKTWLRFLLSPAKWGSEKAAGVRAPARTQQSSSPGLSGSQNRGFGGPVLTRHWPTKSSGSGNSSTGFWWALPLTSETSELQSSWKQLPCWSELHWRKRRSNLYFLIKFNSIPKLIMHVHLKQALHE